MERLINNPTFTSLKGVDIKMGTKLLIATLYNPNPVMLAVTRMSAERLILLIDKKPNKEQEAALKKINDAFGSFTDISTIKVDVYDIVAVAKECVKVIDAQPMDEIIYVNITSGRKPMAIGLLFAAYARHDKVKKIGYNPEEDKNAVVYLPKLSFKLNDSQKKVLEYIDEGKYDSIMDLSEKIDLSKAMLYRAIAELEDMDLVSVEKGIELTDAGRIVRL